MELSETFPVAAPPDRVWAFVDDAAALADCIPGAELLSRREDGTYEGRIAFTLGPKQIHFSGTVMFENDVPARRGTLDVKGADARGGSRAKGHVKYVVEPLDDGTRSNVTLVASLVFYGPLAGFAETGGMEVGRRILREFASCLAAKVEATSSTAAANVTARKIRSSQLLLAALRGWLQRAPWRRWRERATPISPKPATNGNPHDAREGKVMTTSSLDTYLDAWLKHHDRKPSTCEEMIAGSAVDLVYEDVPSAMVFRGHDGVRAICGNSPGWVDEMRLTVVDKQFNGSRWTVEWEASGIDSTAKRPFRFRGTSVGTVDDEGKVNSHRDYWDTKTLLGQVATPESLPDEVQLRLTRPQANMVLELVTRAAENGAAGVDELDDLSKLLAALSYGEHLQG